MPPFEQFAVHPHARSRSTMLMKTAMDMQARSGHGKTNCGFCGRAWFGDVAFCPYCGRRAAGAPTVTDPNAPTAADDGLVGSHPALAAARADKRGVRWKAWWKPCAGAAMVLVVTVIAMQERLTPSGDTAGRPDGRPTPASAPAPATVFINTPALPARGTSADTARAPAAEPVAARSITQPPQQFRAPAPATSRRSLCSAANEAAGLCNPQ